MKTRLHEWLADHVRGVQYPRIYPVPPRYRRAAPAGLVWRWSVMTWRERGWVLFWLYVGGAALLAVYGNLLP